MSEHRTLTKNQLHVLRQLEAATAPLSAYILLDQLRDHGSGAATGQ